VLGYLVVAPCLPEQQRASSAAAAGRLVHRQIKFHK
jgi:hypothetical protein